MSYMQVALADGQTKIVGILGVKWNTILIWGYENKKYHFLSFVKIPKRRSTRADHVDNVNSTINMLLLLGWFELWTQYPGSVVPLATFTKLNKWYFLFSYSLLFLVIRFIFQFTSKIPILLWPSASATCIYDIDYELQGIALNWHHQSYWVGIIISQSHIK